MSIPSRALCAVAAVLIAGVAFPAHADLSVARRATKNVSCSGGSCVATARNAVMNVADLQNLLASQSAVSLDAGPAKNIAINTALTWTSSATLSLTANGSLIVNKPVTVAGKAGVTIQSNGLSFGHKASLSFWDLGSSLTINRHAYALVSDIKSLATAINGGGSAGFYALSNDYDAAADGTYNESPIIGNFAGTFEGLGHTIVHFSMLGSGFFEWNSGVIENFSLLRASAEVGGNSGILVGKNDGLIDHARVTGTMLLQGAVVAGGLVGVNEQRIANSHANIRIIGDGGDIGGLVGQNEGEIQTSYAEGRTEMISIPTRTSGGLVGINDNRIENCYSLTAIVRQGTSFYGGLIEAQIAEVERPHTIASYAAGKVESAKKSGGLPGGVVGYQDTANPSTYSNVYWDTDTDVHNRHDGAANVPDQSGLTGLTDAQLKSGLPPGFDPKIWGQSPSINNGYPYLLSNPPQ
ncbi:MAG TPA: hypothetical protein VHU23_12555 [Rhizomicrobium sp.]|jgi:hypothetical protein|nr:hypothetical protein [Rhizomicrobium sp.]